jgi:outer membrane protein assembly factor BamB
MRRKSFWIIAALSVACGCVVYGAAQWTMIKGDLARTGVVNEEVKPPLALKWQYTTPPFANNLSAPLVGDVDGKTVVYFPVANEVFAAYADTGELAWANPYELPNNTSGPATLASLPDGRLLLLVNCSDTNLYALNAKTGALEWRIPNGASIHAAPTIINGKIYAGTSRPGIYVASPSDGSVLSNESISGSGQLISTPSFADDSLFYSDNNGRIYKVDIARKLVEWQAAGDSTSLTTPVIWKDFILVGNGGRNTIKAFSIRRGDVRWQVPLSGAVYASPTVTPDGKIYVGTSDGKFYALDANNRGRILWQADLQTDVRAAATVTPNGMVFVGTTGGVLFGLDGSSGRVLWKYRLPTDSAKPAAIRAPLTIVNGQAYLLADDGSLYCFSSDAFDAGPPLVSKAHLVVQARDRKLYNFPLPSDKEVEKQEEEPMLIPGLPPIKLTMKLEDLGSGLDESSIAVNWNGQRVQAQSVEYKTLNATLTITLAALGGTQRALLDGRHTVTIAAKDWQGNLLLDNRIFEVDRSAPAPDPPAGAAQPGGVGLPGAGGAGGAGVGAGG